MPALATERRIELLVAGGKLMQDVSAGAAGRPSDLVARLEEREFQLTVSFS